MADQFVQGNYADLYYPTPNVPNPMYFNNYESGYTVPTPSIFVHANRAPQAHEDIEHTKLFTLVTEKMREEQMANSASRPQPKAISRYKTELCRNFHETGQCKYGSECFFAHGFNEMRIMQRHPKYKTELCRIFHSVSFCPFGVRCFFIHNPSEKTEVRQLQERIILNYARHAKLSKGTVYYGIPAIPAEECSPYETEPNVGMGYELPTTSQIMNTKADIPYAGLDWLQTVELDGAAQGLIDEYPHYSY